MKVVKSVLFLAVSADLARRLYLRGDPFLTVEFVTVFSIAILHLREMFHRETLGRFQALRANMQRESEIAESILKGGR